MLQQPIGRSSDQRRFIFSTNLHRQQSGCSHGERWIVLVGLVGKSTGLLVGQAILIQRRCIRSLQVFNGLFNRPGGNLQAIILRLCFLLLCSRVEQLGSSEAEADSLCRPDGVEELSHIDLARTPPDTTRDDQAQHVRHPERVSQHGVVVGTFRANPSPALRVDADRDSILTMKAR
jgi:hypothetical protein